MNNFSRGGRTGGRGGRDGGGNRGGFRSKRREGFGGGRDRDARPPQTMHTTICSECGKSCEVPFRPTGDKPVYCRDCFTAHDTPSNDRFDKKFDRKPKRDFSSNDRSERPVSQNIGSGDELKKQLEGINAKLEILISTLKSFAPKTEEIIVEKSPVKEVSEKKVATKKISKKDSAKKSDK
jgi:CxxC-x17-CxxC domain-containing protein